MGSLIHIFEVAALIFAAYVIGWVVGYVLRRVTARQAVPTAVAEMAQAAQVASPQANDALVRSPVVVPVAHSVPPHVQAKVTQIEPATAVAVPDGMVPAEAKTFAVAKTAAAPISALESLKSLSTTAIPLAPINVRPITGMAEAEQPPLALAAEPVASPEQAGGIEHSLPLPEPVLEPQEPALAEVPAEPRQEPVANQPPSASADAYLAERAVAPRVVRAEPAPENERAVEPQPVLAVAVEPVSVIDAEPAAEAEAVLEPVAVAEAEVTPGSGSPAVSEPGPDLATEAPLAMPSSRPGVAWAGAIKGREARPFERVAEAASDGSDDDTDQAAAGLDVTRLDSLADELQVDEPALPIDELDALAPQAPAIETPAAPIEDAPPTQVTELESTVHEEEPEPIAEATPQPRQPERSEFDEDAAMRAIEGGWSRRATRAMSDAYELTDVSAAVSAAQMAVEQVLAANGIDPSEQGMRAQAAFGKPRGLPQPRNGHRDNLKRINGLGPLDESTLNNLGVYHFDQIAAWDQKEVLWMENHAFARGRIGREDWQGQAKALIGENVAGGAG